VLDSPPEGAVVGFETYCESKLFPATHGEARAVVDVITAATARIPRPIKVLFIFNCLGFRLVSERADTAREYKNCFMEPLSVRFDYERFELRVKRGSRE
jgi:hypothetical protein